MATEKEKANKTEKSDKKIINTAGKRKQAIARATLKPGKGTVYINHLPLDYFQPKFARLKLREPFILAGDLANNINVKVKVRGGGITGQTEAARLAIARGLVAYHNSDELKNRFLEYDRHLLVADVRRNEPAKPNRHGKPRQKVQKSYR